jgi:hypothetical protein
LFAEEQSDDQAALISVVLVSQQCRYTETDTTLKVEHALFYKLEDSDQQEPLLFIPLALTQIQGRMQVINGS